MILPMHTVDQKPRVRPVLGVPSVGRDKGMAAVVVNYCTRGCKASRAPLRSRSNMRTASIAVDGELRVSHLPASE
jgi:hypothetical protein